MEICITDDITHIHEVSSHEYNISQINSISAKHKELRNKSKAPTFALT